MNREEQEHLLVEYALGKLDWEQSEKLEALIRSDPRVRDQLFRLQEGLEADVMKLPQKDVDLIELKRRISGQLGMDSESEPFTRVLEKKASMRTRIFSWSGWAVAAAFVVVSVIAFVGNRPSNQLFDPTRNAALAVFELGGAVGGTTRGALIKDIVYADSLEDDDVLYQAELTAERLWDQYLKQYRNKSKRPDSKGFVVYDLKGKQGFVGIYDQVFDDRSLSTNGEFILSFASNEKALSIGTIRPDENEIQGVFFFSMGEDLNIQLPQSATPVLSRGQFEGI